MTIEEIKQECYRATFGGDDGKVYKVYDIDKCIELMQRKVDKEMEDGELLTYNCEQRIKREMIDKATKCFGEFLNIRSTCNTDTTNEMIRRERGNWIRDFKLCLVHECGDKAVEKQEKTIREQAEDFAQWYAEGISDSGSFFNDETFVSRVAQDAYIQGYHEMRDAVITQSLNWLKTNYGHFDGSLEDLLKDYVDAISK